MDFSKYNVSSESAVKYNFGLRAYMMQVFNYMAVALFFTGITALYASSDAFMSLMVTNGANGASLSMLGWVIQLAPLFIVFFLSYKIQSMSVQAAKTTFWVYSVAMGLSLGAIFHQYTGESIARAFFITASVFGAMSIYGYTTKKDLTSFGSFLFMGLLGIIFASIINIFLKSSALAFASSVIGVLIFTGLTAYDVQKIKSMYYHTANLSDEASSKSAIYGALTLYIDFINLFIMLLRFFGTSRRD